MSGVMLAATAFAPTLSATLTTYSYSRITNTASITVGADGNIYATDGGASSLQYAWLLAGTVSQAEVRMTVLSGTFTSGTTGSWLACTSDRTWERSWPGGMAPLTAQGTLEIRNAVTLDVVASATITLNATP